MTRVQCGKRVKNACIGFLVCWNKKKSSNDQEFNVARTTKAKIGQSLML
jgi:hypothetical protein